MNSNSLFRCEELRGLDYSTFVSSDWVNLGTPLLHASCQLTIQNYTNEMMQFQLYDDGNKAHYQLAAGDSMFIDISTNAYDGKGLVGGVLYQIKARPFTDLPTQGLVIASVMYAGRATNE